MQQFDYYILDGEGYVLLTLKSQHFATEDAAFNSLRPVLYAVREQYGDDPESASGLSSTGKRLPPLCTGSTGFAVAES